MLDFILLGKKCRMVIQNRIRLVPGYKITYFCVGKWVVSMFIFGRYIINVNMSTIVGILKFITRKNYWLWYFKSEISINLGYFSTYEQFTYKSLSHLKPEDQRSCKRSPTICCIYQ